METLLYLWVDECTPRSALPCAIRSTHHDLLLCIIWFRRKNIIRWAERFALDRTKM